jgi:hypothetical protein
MGSSTTAKPAAKPAPEASDEQAATTTRKYRKGFVVIYSLDQGSTFKVANKETDEDGFPVGYGEHSSAAKQQARTEVEELREAIDGGSEPLVASIPASSFQPRPAKLKPARVTF